MKIIVSSPTKFPLGETVITANARNQLDPVAVVDALSRHSMGDWGEVSKSDARLNHQALQAGDRILSVHRDGTTPFWIITEADRSITTVLMPDDY